MRVVVGTLLILIGIAIIAFVFYRNSQYSIVTRTFSPYTLLSSSWEKYKQKFINQDGRVIDYSQGSVTTSEGQSYAMLRAVWIDDKPTFDSVWKWTKENLKRPNDNLFGWRWGQRADKTYGFMPGGGENAASDADTDITLALILASRRWKQPDYQSQALPILADIWQHETEIAAGKRYVIAGNWASDNNRLIINPSYFAPYAWRIFAQVDPNHDWTSLIDPAYAFLQNVGTTPLDTGTGSGLPPDWVAIMKVDGSAQATGIDEMKTHYSYDALRVPWRIAIDYQWNQESRARDYLISSFQSLRKSYASNSKLASEYAHDGKPINTAESPSMYGTSLAFFSLTDPQTADEIYKSKVTKLYSNDTNSFDNSIGYYDQNWLWFSIAEREQFLRQF